ncbi:hypothetical protein GOP47_0027909 [Adiantum capillus-veneris]|nr:hypothetical protein GOP47_0027909 [Adiantum capillus-veneris]
MSSQANSTSQAASSRRRPVVQTWSWWDEVNFSSRGKGGGARPWTCKLCPYKRSGGSNKVRAHLLHEPGHEVKFCPHVAPEKRLDLLEKLTVYEVAEAAKRGRFVAVDPSATATPREQREANLDDISRTFKSHGSTPSSSLPHRQTTLNENWNPKLKEEVDRSVARFFFHDHIAFHASRSPYFRTMVTKIGEYGSSYVPPSSERFRTTFLDKEKLAVEQAAQATKDLWETNGVSLLVDGWSDTRKRSIHGVVAYSRGEMYFVESHDASDSGKAVEMLAAEWTSTIEITGPENVFCMVADGEASNRAAGAIIEGMYPSIHVTFCMAHCLNNLLKDIGNLSWISSTIGDTSRIVSFVLNHQKVRHEFSKRSHLSLLKYSETRFAFNWLMLGRLSTCGGALRGLFLSDEFQAMPESTSTVGLKCREWADDAAWWEEVKTLDAMVKPILHLLRVVDGLQPCIGKVYEAMDRMIEALEKLVPDPVQYAEIHGLCELRWNGYYFPLHAAAYVLDPEFQGRRQETDKEVSKGWRLALERLEPSSDIRRKIRDELLNYRQKKGSYGCVDAQLDRNKIGSVLWWEDYGGDGPHLQRLAVRVLSQACTTSCLEQLWSVYSHIASKKRNRLGVQRANDLVFVSANLRMLAKSVTHKADPFTEWEMAQENPSMADTLLEELEEDFEPQCEPPELEPSYVADDLDYDDDVEIQQASTS